MHPPDCGEWEYDNHPDAATLLPRRCEAALTRAQQDPALVTRELKDGRTRHRAFFESLTPLGQDYLAGNYRGSDFRCLKYRPAVIANRVRVVHTGADPEHVHSLMDEFHQSLLETVDALLAAPRAKGKKRGLTDAQFLGAVSDALAAHLEMIFTIHPYANGNGHMGRWMVWLALIKLKKFPRDWPLEERPPYEEAVQLHREGKPEALQRFILKCIRGY